MVYFYENNIIKPYSYKGRYVMKENEEKTGNISEQKSKIRERYKGVDQDMLDVIPAIPMDDFYSKSSIKRVAVYARVSTDSDEQFTSYEADIFLRTAEEPLHRYGIPKGGLAACRNICG